MPMIIVRYVTPTPRPDLRARIAELAARLGAEKLGKMPAVTAMLIEEADPQSWFIGSRHPTDEGLSAFWMDFKITVGTNTKDETTAFVKAAYEGGLPPFGGPGSKLVHRRSRDDGGLSERR